MTRMAGRTSLILGALDVQDLRAALDTAISEYESGILADRRSLEEMDDDERVDLQRLYQLRRRLSAAAARIARGRNGRSEAAV